MKKNGFVSLVGAGPGDPGLLTVKARQKLEEADLVIYDYLVNPEHLRHTKRSCESLCVGKGFRHKKMSQERINERIIMEARRGKKVVRLKGGDPYLFGRGGEEALFLQKNKISFDVVPGVTSASACASYAGIPLTHREHNASVTFLTGHRAASEGLDSIDWASIASMPGTLVIYMGFYNLAIICRRLIESGMRPDMPAAVIEWGTLPRQIVCEGVVEDIAERVRLKKMKPPCLIVIGDVVKLRAELNWFEKLPLFGKRALVTRTQERASSLSSGLAALGALVTELPTIEIRPPKSWSGLDAAIQELKETDWLIFASVYGVEAFFGRFLEKHKKDARTLAGIKVACVGPETAKALRNYGIVPDLIPKDHESRAIPQALLKKERTLRGKDALLVRADIAPKELEAALRRLGMKVRAVTGYRTLSPALSPRMRRELLAEPPDYLTFTSASTAKNLSRMLGLGAFKRLASRCVVASIGPVTTKTLRTLGVRVHCQAKEYHVAGLLNAIESYAGRKK